MLDDDGSPGFLRAFSITGLFITPGRDKWYKDRRFAEGHRERFPGLQLAWDTLRGASGSTTVLNAANEEAVAAFLAGVIRFDQIHGVNAGTLQAVSVAAGEAADIDGLMQLDARSRRQARQQVQRLAR